MQLFAFLLSFLYELMYMTPLCLMQRDRFSMLTTPFASRIFTEMNKEGIPITLILVVVLYLGGELVSGLFNSDNVSQLTHIVGGVCGLVFGFTLRGRGRGKR